MIPSGPLSLFPVDAPVDLTWNIPGSKSITNRALVLAALASGSSTLAGVLQSDDTLHMRSCLGALGVGITELDATTFRITGGQERLRASKEPLFVGNSGTTVRFLTALAAVVPGAVHLNGDQHMQRRPIADLVDGLTRLGVRVDCPSGCPPVTVHGGRLPGGKVSMRGDRSSQYFSALLMAAGAASDVLELDVEGELVSRPYVDITLSMMRSFGGKATSKGTGFVVEPTAGYQPTDYRIEPDASSASYAFAAAVATGGRVRVPGLTTGCMQGDYAFAELLEQTGATVVRDADSTTVTGTRTHRGIDVDMHHISDTVMTLAALAPLFDAPTTIRNVANIRIKETDRLLATVTELKRLGQQVDFGDDWLRVTPRPITPATVHCYSDHRIAMSFAILGLARDGITLEDPACVAKTYPGFWNDLKRCYDSVGKPAPY